MLLTIKTDSKFLANTLTSFIEKARRVEPSTTGHNKYFFFKCKSDLMEALYWCAITGTKGINVSLDTIPPSRSTSNELEYIIETGNPITARKRKHESLFYFDDNLFIFNE